MSLNFVTFNQDNSLIGIGTSKGFRQYTTEPFAKLTENNEGDVAIIEMLYSTSLVALVLSPRLLRIMNTRRGTTIVELTFPTMILATRMNKKRLAVVLENDIYLYDMSNMKNIQQISTSPNPHALCVLSASSDNNYMIYPRPTKRASQTHNQPAHAPPPGEFVSPTSGEVLIYDTQKLEAINVIEAHQTSLCCIALNNDGTMLATSSEKGTIIRVFSVPDGQKLYQFRRGSLPAQIFSMAFNSTSTLICVSSATETIHVFRLVSPQSRVTDGSSMSGSSMPSHSRSLSSSSITRSTSPGADEHGHSRPIDESVSTERAKTANTTFASMLRRTSQNVGMSLAARVGGYLPTSVTEIWEPQRDFAWFKLPKMAIRSGSGPLGSVVSMSTNHPQILVVTSEGYYYVFSIDLEKGGEGVMEHQFSLMEIRQSPGVTTDD